MAWEIIQNNYIGRPSFDDRYDISNVNNIFFRTINSYPIPPSYTFFWYRERFGPTFWPTWDLDHIAWIKRPWIRPSYNVSWNFESIEKWWDFLIAYEQTASNRFQLHWACNAMVTLSDRCEPINNIPCSVDRKELSIDIDSEEVGFNSEYTNPCSFKWFVKIQGPKWRPTKVWNDWVIENLSIWWVIIPTFRSASLWSVASQWDIIYIYGSDNQNNVIGQYRYWWWTVVDDNNLQAIWVSGPWIINNSSALQQWAKQTWLKYAIYREEWQILAMVANDSIMLIHDISCSTWKVYASFLYWSETRNPITSLVNYQWALVAISNWYALIGGEWQNFWVFSTPLKMDGSYTRAKIIRDYIFLAWPNEIWLLYKTWLTSGWLPLYNTYLLSSKIWYLDVDTFEEYFWEMYLWANDWDIYTVWWTPLVFWWREVTGFDPDIKVISNLFYNSEWKTVDIMSGDRAYLRAYQWYIATHIIRGSSTEILYYHINKKFRFQVNYCNHKIINKINGILYWDWIYCEYDWYKDITVWWQEKEIKQLFQWMFGDQSHTYIKTIDSIKFQIWHQTLVSDDTYLFTETSCWWETFPHVYNNFKDQKYIEMLNKVNTLWNNKISLIEESCIKDMYGRTQEEYSATKWLEEFCSYNNNTGWPIPYCSESLEDDKDIQDVNYNEWDLKYKNKVSKMGNIQITITNDFEWEYYNFELIAWWDDRIEMLWYSYIFQQPDNERNNAVNSLWDSLS